MRRIVVLVVAAVAALVVSGAAGSAGSGQARWVIRDLGSLGGKLGEARDVNGRGQVVGTSETKKLRMHAFLWQNGKMRDLGVSSGRLDSVAEGINDRGQVVGSSCDGSSLDPMTQGRCRAFLWENGHMHDLGSLHGGTSAGALAINNRGEVVGWSETEGGRTHAFLWQNGRMRDLGVVAGTTVSEARAINERGQVVGASGNVPFLWQNGQMKALAGFKVAAVEAQPGRPWGYSAEAINEQGQIVGSNNAGHQPPFFWENGKPRWLCSLYANMGVEPAATGISDRGHVVGDCDEGPFLWHKGQSADDLPVLPSDSGSAHATAIGNNDWIVGSRANLAGISPHPVLWTLRSG